MPVGVLKASQHRRPLRGFQLRFKPWLPSLWEVILITMLVLFVTPDTWISRAIEAIFLPALERWDLLDIAGHSRNDSLVYCMGYAVLLRLLLEYRYVRRQRDFAPISAGFVNAICFVSVLYLVDYFHSTADPFLFFTCWWPFFVFSAFFIVALFLDSRRALRLTGIVLAAITLQSLYAIIYYILGIEQFHTPGFGDRTSGTLHNPSYLYPLCLIAMPLSLTLSMTHSSLWMRRLYGLVSVINLLALLFTYMRSGWLALAGALLYLSLSVYSPLYGRRVWRILAGILIIGLIVVTLLSLMRTQFVWWPLHPIGYAVGNTDTMTWIWFPTLLGWLCKWLSLRYGGIKMYRQALPFFIGLVLGDYAISGLWAIYFQATGMPGYRTFPI